MIICEKRLQNGVHKSQYHVKFKFVTYEVFVGDLLEWLEVIYPQHLCFIPILWRIINNILKYGIIFYIWSRLNIRSTKIWHFPIFKQWEIVWSLRGPLILLLHISRVFFLINHYFALKNIISKNQSFALFGEVIKSKKISPIKIYTPRKVLQKISYAFLWCLASLTRKNKKLCLKKKKIPNSKIVKPL